MTEKVKRLLESSFDEEVRTDAKGLLERCQTDEGDPDERLQLALIKLSHGDLCKLSHLVEDALNDPRDILYWAEYPDPSDLLGGDQPSA